MSKRRQYSDPAQAFAARTERDGDCLVWTGWKSDKGYAMMTTGRRNVRVHRWIYEQHHGPIPPGVQIDHECQNHSCVNIDHLRPATNKQNAENKRGARSDSRSGIRGVKWVARKNRWQANVTHHGKRINLGLFTDPEEAGRVAAAKRAELFTHDTKNPNRPYGRPPSEIAPEEAA